jgi:hypothetical protein
LGPGAPAFEPTREPAQPEAQAGLRVPCAIAGNVVFCPSRSGEIHRAGLGGEGDHVVASGRKGTRAAAGLLGGTHVALAYLASRKTSEGWVSEAWLAVDDEPPTRLSEDGAGATAIALGSRGASLLALGVDARSALTALHARPIAYDHGVRLGEDVVVFVGGPGDRGVAAALALPPGRPGWGLLPIARDVADFGLAVVTLEDPPRVDEPAMWSMYPNGIDPAPLAVATHGERTWVARVRPENAEPGAPRVLELGEVTDRGEFAPQALVPTGEKPAEVDLATGPQGDLWLAWVDASGAWVERLACR